MARIRPKAVEAGTPSVNIPYRNREGPVKRGLILSSGAL